METRIGTSGWSYAHWDEVLYHGAAPARRLGLYGDAFDTVELNASFYRWPKSSTEQDLHWWRDRIDEWRRDGHDVYAYFNNDGGGNAVRNARTLGAMVGRDQQAG